MNGIENIGFSKREYESQEPEPAKKKPGLTVLEKTSFEFEKSASDGLLSVSFYEKLQSGKSMQQMVGLSSSEAAVLVREHVLSRMPFAPADELGKMAEKVYNALSYATYKEMERQICLRVSYNLKDTAKRLHTIAGNDRLLDEFQQGVSADPQLSDWTKTLTNEGSAPNREKLRRSLCVLAASMERQASGLHAEYLRGREKPLEEHPVVAREMLRSLPADSFMRDAFLEHESQEKKRREFWSDAQEWLKTGSSIGLIFASGGLAKLAKVGKLAVEYQSSQNAYAKAGHRAAAALAAGGANSMEFQQAMLKRENQKLLDRISMGLSALSLATGNVLAENTDKIGLRLITGILKTAGSPRSLELAAENGNRLRQLIVQLTR